MSVKDHISDNSDRTIESFVANAQHAVSGTYYVDGTDEVTYDFCGIIVESNAVVEDVSGFDSVHQNYDNGDTLLATTKYYPISGTSIHLTSGTVILIKR